jgi:hypothetical protein
MQPAHAPQHGDAHDPIVHTAEQLVELLAAGRAISRQTLRDDDCRDRPLRRRWRLDAPRRLSRFERASKCRISAGQHWRPKRESRRRHCPAQGSREAMRKMARRMRQPAARRRTDQCENRPFICTHGSATAAFPFQRPAEALLGKMEDALKRDCDLLVLTELAHQGDQARHRVLLHHPSRHPMPQQPNDHEVAPGKVRVDSRDLHGHSWVQAVMLLIIVRNTASRCSNMGGQVCEKLWRVASRY